MKRKTEAQAAFLRIKRLRARHQKRFQRNFQQLLPDLVDIIYDYACRFQVLEREFLMGLIPDYIRHDQLHTYTREFFAYKEQDQELLAYDRELSRLDAMDFTSVAVLCNRIQCATSAACLCSSEVRLNSDQMIKAYHTRRQKRRRRYL